MHNMEFLHLIFVVSNVSKRTLTATYWLATSLETNDWTAQTQKLQAVEILEYAGAVISPEAPRPTIHPSPSHPLGTNHNASQRPQTTTLTGESQPSPATPAHDLRNVFLPR